MKNKKNNVIIIKNKNNNYYIFNDNNNHYYSYRIRIKMIKLNPIQIF